MNDKIEPTDFFDEEPSKSQIKREFLEITEFGRQLIETLKPEQIKRLPLEESLIDEILKAQTMQRIARKRQIQYVGKLMRKTDIEAAREALAVIMNVSKQAVAQNHRLEQWRDRLVDKDRSAEALTELVAQYPSIDIQGLRQLIRNHHKEIEQKKAPKSYRQIFQIIKQAVQEA